MVCFEALPHCPQALKAVLKRASPQASKPGSETSSQGRCSQAPKALLQEGRHQQSVISLREVFLRVRGLLSLLFDASGSRLSLMKEGSSCFWTVTLGETS
jgi:hypothetical protein